MNRRRRFFFIAVLGLCIAVRVEGAAPASNPFGLPTAETSGQVGAVLLRGGGRALREEVRREFVRLADGKNARIVLMPSDMMQRGKDADGKPLAGGETVEAYAGRLSQPANYGRWAARRAEKRVADFQYLYLDADRDPRGERFYALLEQATGVGLPPYDQEWLSKLFAAEYPEKASRFQFALRKVVARGGVVGGLGGGMACLPETMIARNDSAEDGWVRARVGFGLALLDGVVVDQNVFLQSEDRRAITWHALRPGDEAVVRAANGEYRLDIEDWEVRR